MGELRCWNCGHALDDVPRPISRHATCAACFNELHCCRLCRHFRPGEAGGQCDEDRADPPVVKESANFCDWFRPDPDAYAGATTRKQDAARGALDALFGQPGPDQATEDTAGTPPSPQTTEEAARARLDALFEKKPPKNKM